MNNGTYHILRVGMGITFLWIGILIFRSPETWGGMLAPWAYNLLPVPIEQAMMSTAVLDVIVGLLLIVDVATWAAALVGSIHLIIVLATVGIDEITVRDIGLLTGCIAIMWNALPEKFRAKFV